MGMEKDVKNGIEIKNNVETTYFLGSRIVRTFSVFLSMFLQIQHV